MHFIPKDKISSWHSHTQRTGYDIKEKVTTVYILGRDPIVTLLTSEEVEALYEGRIIDGKPMEKLSK